MSQIDRGGLSYGIDVRDGFSSNLRNFRSEVEKSRVAWRGFRNDFNKTATQTSNIRKDIEAVNRALSKRSTEVERAKKGSRDFAKATGVEAAARREDTKAMEGQNRVAVDRRRSLLLESRAVRRLGRDYNSLRTARGRDSATRIVNSQRTAPGLSGGAAATPAALRSRTREFNQLTPAIDRTDRAANRISFTFRRLFGIMAAFTVARAAVSGFNNLVSSAVRLNAELEQSVLGVAGLLTALGNVSDPTGTIADNAERLSAAQGEARRQLEFLRGDALKTSASFQELADTFQVALAPGFNAGLDLDEIRRLTVRISQAASAIGLPQNQLPEEIRSLLSGTITPRTTRIATALGIDNEDIRNAKEAGELVEFLEQKFAAFAVAGDAALKNFSTILINLKDGLNQILRIGGFTFFDALKSELDGLLGTIASVNEQGNIVFNPEAIKVIKEISDGLRDAVLEAAAIGDALDLRDAQKIAKLLGKTISGIAKVSGPLIESLLTVLSLLGDFVGFVTSIGIVNDVVLSITANALIIAGLVRAILVVVGTVKATLPFIAAQMALIQGVQTGLTLGAIRWQVALRGVALSFLSVAPLFAIAALSFYALRNQAEETQTASDALLETMRQAPAAISQSNSELDEQAEIVKKLTDRFKSAAESFEVSVATAGLEGAVANQKKQAVELSQLTRDLNRQSVQEQQRLVEVEERLRQKRLEAEQSLADFRREQGAAAADTERALLEVQDKQEEIVSLNSQIADLEREGTEEAAARAKVLERQADALRDQQRILVDTLVRDSAQNLAVEQSLSRGGIAAGARQFADVVGQNLRAILNDDFDSLVQPDAVIVSQETFDEADAAVAALSEKLQEVRRVEAEIQSILTQQEQARRSQLQLTIAESQVRALESRAAAEDFVGPFVTGRTSIDGLTGDQEEPPGNITSFINEENEQLRLQAKIRDRLRASVEQLGNVQQAMAQNELAQQQHELDFLRRRNLLAEEAVRSTIALNAEQTQKAQEQLNAIGFEDTKTRDLLTDQLVLLRQESVALDQQLETLGIRNRLLEEAQQYNVLEAADELSKTQDTFNNVIRGFQEGLQEANKNVSTAYQISAKTTLEAVQGLSNLISDTIVDAFDPTNDKTIEQRIGAFLQSIGRMLIQLTTQALLFRYALGAIGGGVGGAASGGLVQGLASGGLVRSLKNARGYATGGVVGRSPVRPSGLAASDTVPAWLTPGEQVIKKPSVRMYGADTMAAINNGLVDPGSLRSLAGLTKRRRIASKRSGRMGYAEGGLVGSAASGGRLSSLQGPDDGPTMPLVAIPANDATLEALFAGGKNAVFAFMQANQGKVRAALSIPRS